MSGQGSRTGRLYGLGVGPGDPELVTLKASRILADCPVVAYPVPDRGASFARSIVAGLIRQDAVEIPIVVPMVPDRTPAEKVYDGAAEGIAAQLDQGRDVAVLCAGDPFFYGSFMYLFERLAGRYPAEVVPGVSSLSACAAALGRPLAARNDVFSVIPAPLPEDEIRRRLEGADAAAIVKLGRHYPKVLRVLAGLGLVARSGYVERATIAGQRVVRPLEESIAEAPYFSMILVYRGGEPWI